MFDEEEHDKGRTKTQPSEKSRKRSFAQIENRIA